MICRLAAAPLGWGCNAPAVVQDLATALAAVIAVTAAAWFVHACLRRSPPAPRGSVAGVLATVFAVVLLAIAAGRPEALPARANSGRHVVFVVDISESATRDRASFAGALVRAAAAVGVPGTRRPDRDDGDVASLIVFGADHEVIATAASEGAVIAHLATPGRLADTPSLDRDGSVPGPALGRALDLIATARRPAEIVLVSDGLWTPARPGRDGLDDAVRRAAASAVPIHVFPVNAGPPARGIVAAHLARTIDAGTEAPIRLVLAGGGPDDTATLGISILGDEPETRTVAGAEAAQPLRIARRFDGRGLQFAEVTLTAGGRSQRRRLYTTVVGPPRLFVLGDAAWADRLPRERFEVHRVDPGEAFDPREADVVVIDAVPGGALPPAQTRAIAQAVTENGTGLFLVNGGLRGAPTDDTVARSYAGTPLGPLLPVAADPDRMRREPPPRTVALVIDASGSMGAPDGAPERTAQALARQVLDRLEDRDRVIIDTFPRIAGAILDPLVLSPEGRRRAERYIDGLYASGGSDAGEGVDLVARLSGPSCAAFIITDGDVAGGRMFVPGCHLSYLEIGEGAFVNGDLERAARRNGQAEKVSGVGPLPRLTFSFFDPGTDKTLFRPGRAEVASPLPDRALAPLIAVDGVAVSRPLPQADVLLFRDAWPADPVLAFRHPPDGHGGETGVFMSSLDGRWTTDPDGREAIMRHLARLAAWQDREHFEIDLEEEATGRGRLTVTGLGDGGRTLPLGSVTAVLDLPGIGSDPVPLTEVSSQAGVLSGTFELPRRGPAPGDAVVHGSLRLSEAGRAPARIPAVLPVVDRGSGGVMTEAFTGGQDLAALTALARATGGTVDPGALTRPPPPPDPPREPRHGIPLAFATLFSVIAFLSRGSRT